MAFRTPEAADLVKEKVILAQNTEEPELGVRAVLRVYDIEIPAADIQNTQTELGLAAGGGHL